MDTLVRQTIIDAFEEKRVKGERWENEYGCLHIKKFRKEYYYDSSQYKIQLQKKNNIMFFKIVPKCYQIPFRFQYWDYYDGFVNEKCIEWKRIQAAPFLDYI